MNQEEFNLFDEINHNLREISKSLKEQNELLAHILREIENITGAIIES